LLLLSCRGGGVYGEILASDEAVGQGRRPNKVVITVKPLCRTTERSPILTPELWDCKKEAFFTITLKSVG
jgi:hypothetical protein